MGPAFESVLLVLLLVAVAIGAIGWIFRPQWRRAYRYFLEWAARDRREEERALAEKALREKAEAELREKLVEDDDEPETQVQKVTN